MTLPLVVTGLSYAQIPPQTSVAHYSDDLLPNHPRGEKLHDREDDGLLVPPVHYMDLSQLSRIRAGVPVSEMGQFFGGWEAGSGVIWQWGMMGCEETRR